MQRLKISHYTEYQFPDVVILQPHRLLLRPREGHDVHIESSLLDISPAHVVKWHRDVFDNSVAVVSFTAPAARLSIASEVVIEHYEQTPLDFLIEDYAAHYPFAYDADERIDLMAYQQPVYPDDADAAREWARRFQSPQGGTPTFALLDAMNRAIENEWRYVVREAPGIQSPAQTLASRTGSCRDYATLFMEVCRHLGIASRFVSGYLHAPATEAGNATSHAWAEVYLPGCGWKGFDPTLGEVAGSRHIAVAVSRRPDEVSPVAGSYLGPASPIPALIVNVQVTLL
jgi:transglutaminase-like putative cysteine protease